MQEIVETPSVYEPTRTHDLAELGIARTAHATNGIGYGFFGAFPLPMIFKRIINTTSPARP